MEVHRRFSWEGFCNLDVIGVVKEAGHSGAETKRLFKANAIKIWDTKVLDDGCHYVWYKRVAERTELVEPEDEICIGKHQLVIIQALPFPFYLRVFYKIRDLLRR